MVATWESKSEKSDDEEVDENALMAIEDLDMKDEYGIFLTKVFLKLKINHIYSSKKTCLLNKCFSL